MSQPERQWLSGEVLENLNTEFAKFNHYLDDFEAEQGVRLVVGISYGITGRKGIRAVVPISAFGPSIAPPVTPEDAEKTATEILQSNVRSVKINTL